MAVITYILQRKDMIKIELPARKKLLLSIQETAEALGLAPRYVYNRIAPNAKDPFPIKAKRIGRRVLFDIRDIEAYVASL
jgi:predicted DNA-binding transcriptional regulator AlpA